MPKKMTESGDVRISEGGSEEGGVCDHQSFGGRKKNGGELSHLEAVGDLYAMDGTIKQTSYVCEKHYADLDIYLDDLGAKLTTTFGALLDN